MKKKALISIIALGSAALLSALALTACGEQAQEVASTAESTIDTAVDATVDTVGDAVEAGVEVVQNVSDTVEFGDYDGMFTLAKAIQNGEKADAIVKIDGVIEYLGSGASIGERNDTEFIGTSLKGSDSVEFPADGTHVILTGKVVQDGLVNLIEATSIEVVESEMVAVEEAQSETSTAEVVE